MSCQNIPDPSDISKIRLPGPIRISGAPLTSLPSKSEVSRALFGQVATALAPFSAIFQLIDTVKALIDVVEAVPKALTEFPPNPGKITSKLPALREKVTQLLSLLPQAALPLLLIDIINALFLFAEGILEELDALDDATARAEAARTTAAGLDPTNDATARLSLEDVASCLDEQLSKRIAGIQASSGPINDTIGIVNSLLEIINLPTIPTLNDLGEDVATARAAVQAFTDTLKPLRDQFSSFAG
jgi:hypothetical protein